MGQSASQLTHDESFEGKELFDLSDGELKVLLEMQTWTKEEVLKVAKSLLQSERPNFGFYAKEDDSQETDLAVRLNDLSKDLAKLRFSMVPSRIKEPIFWESIFTILRERLVAHNAKFKITDVEKNVLLQSSNAALTKPNGHHHQSSPTKISSSFPDDESEETASASEKSLLAQLAAKDKQIAALQRQVEELQAASDSTPKPIGHKGEWIVDQDSKDFLSYPEEVKENMRREKQKRLRQVQQDMKFILDSDKVEDSNGHWKCCGETTYTSACPKSKR